MKKDTKDRLGANKSKKAQKIKKIKISKKKEEKNNKNGVNKQPQQKKQIQIIKSINPNKKATIINPKSNKLVVLNSIKNQNLFEKPLSVIKSTTTNKLITPTTTTQTTITKEIKKNINSNKEDNEKFNLWNPSGETQNQKEIEKTSDSLKGSKFRWLNELLYTSESKDAMKEFTENPILFEEYHNGFKSQVEHWPINPLHLIIKDLKKSKNKLRIADMGCGEAKLAEELEEQHTIHSFDLIAVNNRVTSCDISKVPLLDESVDVVVFCLSLMGTNFLDFIKEASRILVKKGRLRIAEIESRIEDIQAFINVIESYNFKLYKKNTNNQYFTLFTFSKEQSNSDKKGKREKKKSTFNKDTIILKPCLYKKR